MSQKNNNLFQWHYLETSEAVAKTVYNQIAQLSQHAIDHKGEFKLVLAGGTTPGVIYKMLVDLNTDWSKWQIFFGDERCLDSEDFRRNSKMAELNWLNFVSIPQQNIHIIEAQLGAKKAAQLYQQQIEQVLPFDLVLNGMGEDGHTASLFPGQQHDTQQTVHEIYHSPKPPADRVSLSNRTLSTTFRSFIIITGKSKYPAVKDWQNGKILPINQLSCLGEIDVYIDQSALTGISESETNT